MKLLHLADLHIGKRVGEYSMLEDQQYILRRILSLVDEYSPSGVLMAGDIYDKGVPSGEAVELLDEFLTQLSLRRVPVFLISGNHDSPERLNFGSRILGGSGIHIAGTFRGSLIKHTLNDEFGPVNVYLLPFVKPAVVSPYFPEDHIASHEDAIRSVIGAATADPSVFSSKERNILIAHQFITNSGEQPSLSDSENISIGGLDNIDASAFDAFDYVALGHLHGPQRIGRDTIRSAGSPLKYSFSEARQHKSVTLLELGEKGDVRYSLIPLVPLRDMREIRGPIAGLLSAGLVSPEGREDYIHATLTDEDEIFDAVGQLRRVYPNLMRLDFENSRTSGNKPSATAASGDVEREDPLRLFEEFYENQNQQELSQDQHRILDQLFAEEFAAGDSAREEEGCT